jgi:hypothetical protein
VFNNVISGVFETGSIAEKRFTNQSKRVGTGLRKVVTSKSDIICLPQYPDFGGA